jgi:thiol-disulfide isomerase/thioredoxin
MNNFFWLLACLAPALAQSPDLSLDRWVDRTDTELATLLHAKCMASIEDHRPILIEFSASWCADCRQTAVLVTEPAMVAELASWHHVTINVGRLDQHMALAGRLGLDALGFWVAASPTTCIPEIEAWPILRKSSFEPVTGDDKHLTSESLAQWLFDARSPSTPSTRSKEKTPSSPPGSPTSP